MTIRSLTVALMSGVALAAVQLPAVAATDFVPKQAAGEASSSGLIGTKIQNSAGENIGDVNYLVLDASGNVTTVVIGVGGFLGVGEKNVGVPFKSVKKTDDSNGNPVFKLDTSKEELANAPAYEWTEKGAAKQAADFGHGHREGKDRRHDARRRPAGSVVHGRKLRCFGRSKSCGNTAACQV